MQDRCKTKMMLDPRLLNRLTNGFELFINWINVAHSFTTVLILMSFCYDFAMFGDFMCDLH